MEGRKIINKKIIIILIKFVVFDVGEREFEKSNVEK